jgi:hypothetical protein
MYCILCFIKGKLSFRRSILADSGPRRSLTATKSQAETDSEDESDEDEFEKPQRKVKPDGPVDGPGSGVSTALKFNRNGQAILKNGVVALKNLKLSELVNKKKCFPGATPLFKAKLLWGQAYTLFCLIKFGKDIPTEKVRDHDKRLLIMYSASPYALGDDECSALEEADILDLRPYLLGMSKASQQIIKYVLYAKVHDHFNNYVFTKTGVSPSRSDVRLNLGLVGDHADKSFMDM